MEYIHVKTIGFIAGSMTTLSFLPQIIKIVKTRCVRDISLCMYIMLATGIFLWLVYGTLIKELPVILANSIAFVLCFFVIIAKIKYDNEDKT
ncbi:MAG: SemiSWEET transporter [Candidatus Omnitrophota bacterium]